MSSWILRKKQSVPLTLSYWISYKLFLFHSSLLHLWGGKTLLLISRALVHRAETSRPICHLLPPYSRRKLVHFLVLIRYHRAISSYKLNATILSLWWFPKLLTYEVLASKTVIHGCQNSNWLISFRRTNRSQMISSCVKDYQLQTTEFDPLFFCFLDSWCCCWLF